MAADAVPTAKFSDTRGALDLEWVRPVGVATPTLGMHFSREKDYQSLGGNATLELVPNPFFGVAEAGQFATRATIERGQLLRPYPQFGNVYMQQSTGARSQYNAGILQLRRRATGLWGGNFSYTFSRLKDNQFGQSNYYSAAPGIQNNYTVIPGSAYYNPDQEYGQSLLDSPHKLTIAPTLNLPFGKGSHGLTNALVANWSLTTVVSYQSGFPIGVSQNVSGTQYLFGGTLRPNVVDGQSFLVVDDGAAAGLHPLTLVQNWTVLLKK